MTIMQANQQQASLSAPNVKGPRVWLDMDQKELDDAYDQTVYAPNQKLLALRRAAASKATLARLGEPMRLAYGPTEIEKLDIYKTARPNAPVNVYIHGGAWRNGQAKDFAFPAEVFINAGAHFVVVDFVQITETGGDLMPMVGQVRSALAWVYKNAASFGGDADRIYITGHSSGAHLSGCTLVTDWQKNFDLPANIIKGGLLISGMYDLKPVRLSKRSEYVKFTDEIEQALSSQRHLDKLNAPIIVAYGTQETPEFQRQGREFAAAVIAAGKPVELIVGEGFNHFEMQETLGNPYGLGGRAALKLMNLSMNLDRGAQ
ncbi:MAG TPA: alpha/beta hydrolase [Candidatus Saccharimonadales bacterium]|nr:alpha/beta hydrolase [Candidatus Saccharimonadales bacterium]